MTKAKLHKRLNSGRLSKNQIIALVEELLQTPNLVGELLEAIWIEDKENTFNASWTLDHLLRKKLDLILPFVTDFGNGLKNLESESCIRPMAHICEMIVIKRIDRRNLAYKNRIQKKTMEQLVSACFDWLIGSHKVAAKVFAMTSLLHLGTEFKWIHPELKPILENSVNSGTIGYQNRAKKTLLALKNYAKQKH